MNPYDFVRIDWNQNPNRREQSGHDRFDTGYSGRIEGTITALTPIFLPETADLQQKERLLRLGRPISFARNGARQYVIRGSSLKGLFRSLVETLGPGCWWLYDGEYRHGVNRVNYKGKLPHAFRQCPQDGGLCVACRLFGLVRDQSLLLGKVGFDDAVCTTQMDHHPIYTPVLSTPKPRHRTWYLNAAETHVAGRKFYFHFTQILTETDLRPTNGGGFHNSYITPLGVDSKFAFSCQFNNVAADELPLLLYAMTLERTDWGHDHDVRHKLGYGKPAGLGSVAIELNKLTLIDYQQRYRPNNVDKGLTTLTGSSLHSYINHWIQPYLINSTATLQDLRRIWGWPPASGVTYCYPKRTWFDDPANLGAPISATRTAPC